MNIHEYESKLGLFCLMQLSGDRDDLSILKHQDILM